MNTTCFILVMACVLIGCRDDDQPGGTASSGGAAHCARSITYVEDVRAYKLLLDSGHTIDEVDAVLSKQLAELPFENVSANVLDVSSTDQLIIKVMRKPMRALTPGGDMLLELHLDPHTLEIVQRSVQP